MEKNTFQKILSELNIYTMPNKLYFNGSIEYKNKIGFYLSMLTILILFFFVFIFSIYEEYDIQSTTLNMYSESIDFKKVPFIITLITADNEMVFPSNETFELIAQKYTQIMKNDEPNEFNYIYLNMQKCNTLSYNYKMQLQKKIPQFKLDYFMCLSEGQNLIFDGYYLDRSYNFSAIRFSVKQNNENFNLQGANLIAYYVIDEPIHSDTENELIRQRQKSVILKLSNDRYKRTSVILSKGKYTENKHLNIKVKQTEFITENKYINSEINSKNSGDFIDNTDVLGSIDFGFSGEYIIYKKYYTNIMILFSYFGGWLYLIMTIIKIIISFINAKLYFLSLIEKLLSLDTFKFKFNEKLIYIENPFSFYNNKETFEDDFNSNKKEYFHYKHTQKSKTKSINNIVKYRLFNPKEKGFNAFSLNFKGNTNINIKEKSKYKNLRLTENLFTSKILFYPLCCIHKTNKYFYLLLYKYLLKEFIGIESLFYLNKVTKQKIIIDQNDGTSLLHNSDSSMLKLLKANFTFLNK